MLRAMVEREYNRANMRDRKKEDETERKTYSES